MRSENSLGTQKKEGTVFLKVIVIGLIAVLFGGAHLSAFNKAASQHLKPHKNN